MQVSVLYFAALRDLMGAGEERVFLPDAEATVATLRTFLETRDQRLSGFLGSVRFAVNEEFRNGEARLKDGDTVALIPPVQGG
ncbi:MAG: molybdopterin converting factor subunit 1 [Polyangiaceae bacterium]|nr:molybdopterin converting factor subunit 1 [Polyangiaceae bacterium]